MEWLDSMGTLAGHVQCASLLFDKKKPKNCLTDFDLSLVNSPKYCFTVHFIYFGFKCPNCYFNKFEKYTFTRIMAWREQKKFLEELKKYEPRMSEADRAQYKMFVKREKDEEELDTLSMGRLREIHARYCIPVPKRDFNSLFKS